MLWGYIISMARQATTKKSEDLWADLPGFDPIKREFKTLDLGLWLKQHKIEERAKEDGEQNRPSAGQKPTGIPDEIIAWAHRRARKCRENISNWLNDFQIDLTDLGGSEHGKRNIQTTLEDARLDLEKAAGKQRNDLVDVQQTVREAKHDYERFRSESGLIRPPDYEGRKSSPLYISFFFILEIILNAASLMDANPFGLVGATIQMGLICSVNVLFMGSWMGGLVRSLNHIKPLIKCASASLAFLLLLFAIGFNLMVGHFRDSMQAILDDPSADIFAVGSDTFARFSESVIAFDSFQSALLALLGFLFFCFSAWKWFDRDDHYPGYGKKHRLLQEKQADYRNRFNAANDQLRSVFKEYEEKLKDALHRLDAEQARLRAHRARGKSVISDFGVNMEQHQHDLRALLGAYIAANRSTRTEPEPAWFSEEPSIDPKILIPPSFDIPEETNLESVEKREYEAITALQGFYEENRSKFPTLEEAMDYNPVSPEQAASN